MSPVGSVLPASPCVAGLGAAAGIIAFLVAAARPPITGRTVLALVPWMIVVGVLRVVGYLGTYPDRIAPVLRTPGPTFLVVTLAGGAWLVMAECAPGRRSIAVLPHYLGVMGVGTLVVLLPFVVLESGVTSVLRLVWPFAAAAIACLAGVVIVLLLGFWHPDAAAYTGVVGGLVAAAQTLDGVATVLGIGAVGAGAHTPLSRAVMRSIAEFGLATTLSVDPLTLWAWLFLWVKFLVAIAAVSVLARFVHRSPGTVNAGLGLFAAAGLVSGVSGAFLVTVGGPL